MERVGDRLVAAARALRGQLIAEQAETEERATYSPEVHEALLEDSVLVRFATGAKAGVEGVQDDCCREDSDAARKDAVQ